MPQAVAGWAVAAGCTGAAVRSEPGPGVTEFRYRDRAGREPVRLVAVADLGHAWPGGPDPILGDHAGRPSSAYRASAEIWRFFQETAAT